MVLVGSNPAHIRVLELDDLEGPLQPKPFCDSRIHSQTATRQRKNEDQLVFSCLWAAQNTFLFFEASRGRWQRRALDRLHGAGHEATHQVSMGLSQEARGTPSVFIYIHSAQGNRSSSQHNAHHVQEVVLWID